MRSNAVYVLGNIGNNDSRVVDELFLLLKDPESNVRGLAANVLGNIGESDSKIIDKLVQWIEQQSEDQPIESAIDALWELVMT